MLATSVQAANLNVVMDYRAARSPEVWKKVKGDTVPDSLIQRVTQADPSNPYSSLFPRAFYQEENFLVCYRDCANKDPRSGKEALEQQTVYYWLSEFYAMASKRFDLAPTGRVRVMTDRRVANPGSSKALRNNAFFNPADGTLSFLPAGSNPLISILGGDKLNRSGFDPSVIAHEAGHSLFHSLFPHSINEEISGFNEGFADYMANILLDSPELGLVMLRGKVLRDSNSLVDSSNAPKTYAPGLEVHDMGERFAAALWKSRAVISDKDAFDRLVIDAVEDIAKNPYATGHAFKEALLARVQYTYSSTEASQIKGLWDFFVAGSDRKAQDLSFLSSSVPATRSWGMRSETRFSEEAARNFGLTNEVKRFVYVKKQTTSDGLTAHMIAKADDNFVTPYWILVDSARMNVLGAWRLDKSPVTEGEDLEVVTAMAKQAMVADATLEDLKKNAKMFAELSLGTGDLKAAYKVERTDRTVSTSTFNHTSVSTTVIKMKLKRKFLAGLLGVPKVRSVTLTLVPARFAPSDLPQLNGESVIGVALELEDGTISISQLEQIQL
jgi:hypothetical protein